VSFVVEDWKGDVSKTMERLQEERRGGNVEGNPWSIGEEIGGNGNVGGFRVFVIRALVEKMGERRRECRKKWRMKGGRGGEESGSGGGGNFFFRK